jgi:hypothetical protein
LFCNKNEEIIKSHRDFDRPEPCDVCGDDMVRQVVFSGQMAPDKSESHYNHAFGKVIHSKRELRNEIKRHNSEYGTDLQEVGNEKPRVERKTINSDYDGMGRELYRMRKK